MVGKPVSQTLSTMVPSPTSNGYHPWGIFPLPRACGRRTRMRLSRWAILRQRRQGNPRNLVSIYIYIYIYINEYTYYGNHWLYLVIVNDILVYGIPNGFTHVMNGHSIICKSIWVISHWLYKLCRLYQSHLISTSQLCLRSSHDIPGLVNVYILLWKITMFNGKIHYSYGHFP